MIGLFPGNFFRCPGEKAFQPGKRDRLQKIVKTLKGNRLLCIGKIRIACEENDLCRTSLPPCPFHQIKPGFLPHFNIAEYDLYGDIFHNLSCRGGIQRRVDAVNACFFPVNHCFNSLYNIIIIIYQKYIHCCFLLL